MGVVDKKKWLVLPLAKLKKAPWNYKEDDEKKAAKLRKNIERNGQIENLIVRELPDGFYEVCNGNHRLDIFNEMKEKEAMCYNVGKISQAAAERLAVETNETKFATDNLKLGALIEHMLTEFKKEDLIETMPYTEVELENYRKLVTFDWKDDKSPDEAGPEVPTGLRTLFLTLPENLAAAFEQLLADLSEKHTDQAGAVKAIIAKFATEDA